ncbi:GAF domain-containing sensor histidine kinase [Oerskovia flava]|uniref:GAF domain-containing sensor histidine kinase n=1 Tax=Oerskovia flava TaxID=2986422 RepID=UPI00224049E6|nr:GAF domain-containing protein [Oerskovia sp. JB1-3-2]
MSENLPSDVVHRVLDAVVAVSSDLDLDTVLERIVDSAMDLTGARYGALGVTDGPRLVRFVPRGLDDDEVAAIEHWPRGEGLLGELIHAPHPLRVDEIGDDHRSSGFPAGHPPMHTFLGVPVRVRDAVYGNLYLTDKRGGASFTDDDESAVTALAAAAGVAVDNARLYADATRRGLLEDRDRIARDLHDLVIQRLFASAMSLMSIQGLVTDPTARGRIEETVTDLDDTIRQIRSTIFALHTAADPAAPSLDDRVRSAVDAAVRTLGFTPDVTVEADPAAQVPADVADQVVAVLGEALTNVARHALAGSTVVHLAVTPAEVALTVTDDGVGIRPDGRRSGLRNLAVRAQDLGGEFTLEAARADAQDRPGTRLSWRVPVRRSVDPRSSRAG